MLITSEQERRVSNESSQSNIYSERSNDRNRTYQKSKRDDTVAQSAIEAGFLSIASSYFQQFFNHSECYL